jgi:hypothetical protein
MHAIMKYTVVCSLLSDYQSFWLQSLKIKVSLCTLFWNILLYVVYLVIISHSDFAKFKDKGLHINAMQARGGNSVLLHSFLTWALDGGEW